MYCNYCGKSIREDANVYIQNPERQTEAASQDAIGIDCLQSDAKNWKWRVPYDGVGQIP
jgi:hypothetical protein